MRFEYIGEAAAYEASTRYSTALARVAEHAANLRASTFADAIDIDDSEA